MVALFYPDPELGDGVIRVRPWKEDDRDLACIEQAGQDPRIPECTSVPPRFTPEEGRAYIRRQWSRVEDGRGVSLVIANVANGGPLGHVNLLLHPQQGVAGIGYWVVPSARRRGFASRAVKLLTSWGLEQVGLARVEAWVEPDNVGSQRVLAFAGYQRERCLRSFLCFPGRRADALVFSRVAHNA